MEEIKSRYSTRENGVDFKDGKIVADGKHTFCMVMEGRIA